MFEIPTVKCYRKWESLFIIHPDKVEEKGAIFEKLKQIIQSKEGDFLKLEEWGMRKLAYPIQKKTRGYYVLTEFYGLADLPHELENFFRIDERILRYIIIKLDDKFQPETKQEGGN